ncbi:MAG: hypothetical protein BGO29_09375 [Bacteroidales bacterium 36-12]|nr:MAG: hypothetical protein BGO29_09375 [Bacteroidales bacterium 36-12]
MEKTTNILPGRSSLILIIRSIANFIRSWYMIKIKYPWIKANGFLRIPLTTQIWSPHKDITFGNKVQFGDNCVIYCDISFGNNILVAKNVSFIGKDDHNYNQIGKYIWDNTRGDQFKTKIDDDVWIGHGAIILSGVIIGRGSIVAAGTVVTKNIPPYSIVGGNPSKIIKMRFTEDEIKMHEKYLYNE